MERYVHRLKDNVVEMSVLSKMIFRCNSISIIISVDFFVKIDMLALKFNGNAKDLEYPKYLEKGQN